MCRDKCQASRGGSLHFTTLGAIRSDTVGLPSVLSPPCAVGIFTVRTGGGTSRPDASRFQILSRWSGALVSNAAIACSSTPAAPWLALTFF